MIIIIIIIINIIPCLPGLVGTTMFALAKALSIRLKPCMQEENYMTILKHIHTLYTR